MIHAPLFDKHDPTMTVSTQWMSIYERRLNHGSKKSIPYFEGKNNPVKHILALCSILWQGNRGKVHERAGRQHALDALPRYATQCRIAAKRCLTTAWGPIALNQPGSVELCQDMLHRSCLHGGKITLKLTWLQSRHGALMIADGNRVWSCCKRSLASCSCAATVLPFMLL